jgi:hypothetical protein
MWLSCGEHMTLGHEKRGVLAYVLGDEEFMRYREGNKVVVHGELRHAREAVPSHCPDPYIVVWADSIRYAIDPRLPESNPARRIERQLCSEQTECPDMLRSISIPYKVEAALFALKASLSKGPILADEVGLGKIIGGRHFAVCECGSFLESNVNVGRGRGCWLV